MPFSRRTGIRTRPLYASTISTSGATTKNVDLSVQAFKMDSPENTSQDCDMDHDIENGAGTDDPRAVARDQRLPLLGFETLANTRSPVHHLEKIQRVSAHGCCVATVSTSFALSNKTQADEACRMDKPESPEEIWAPDLFRCKDLKAELERIAEQLDGAIMQQAVSLSGANRSALPRISPRLASKTVL